MSRLIFRVKILWLKKKKEKKKGKVKLMISKDVRKKYRSKDVRKKYRSVGPQIVVFFYQNQYLTAAFWPKTITGRVGKEATNKAYLQWPVGPKFTQKTKTINLLKILRDN